MQTEKSTVVTEITLSEDKKERYLYRRIWSRKKAPNLACVLTIHPASINANHMDLTTMLISNAISDMGYDGYLGVNMSSKIKRNSNLKSSDFSEENESVIVDAMNDDQVTKIIIAVGSTIKTNKEVNAELKGILGQLTVDRRELVEVLVGFNGPVHPLAPIARSVGGWKLAKVKI